MKRALVLGLALAFALAGVAAATPRFRVVVPVEIDSVPAAITRARIDCYVASSERFDPTRNIGQGAIVIAIEGGRFSGRVAMDVIPAGFPVGTDGTVEGRSYACSVTLFYRCETDEGDEGWCSSGSGGRPIAGSPETIAALFATDPARPPAGSISGVINRAGAATLPRRTY